MGSSRDISQEVNAQDELARQVDEAGLRLLACATAAEALGVGSCDVSVTDLKLILEYVAALEGVDDDG